MAENPTMENFIPESGVKQPTKKYSAQLRKVGIAHLSFGIISCIAEIAALVVWYRSSIFDLAIPGLIFGVLLCAAGALALLSSTSPSRVKIISGIVVCSIILLVGLGTLAVNFFLLVFLAILEQGFASQLLINIAMILCSIGGFVNSCFHIHFTRKMNQ